MDIDKIKRELDSLVNLPALAESYGVKKGRHKLYHSFYSQDKNPSLSFYNRGNGWRFKCHSTGKGGNSIDFIKDLLNITFIEAVKLLAERYNIDTGEAAGGSPTPGKRPERPPIGEPPPYKPIETDSVLFHERAGIYQSNGATMEAAERYALRDIKDAVIRTLLSDCRDYSEYVADYLTGRGITLETAAAFDIAEIQDLDRTITKLHEQHEPADLELSGLFKGGYFVLRDNRLLIPYRYRGYYIHLKGRYLPGLVSGPAELYNPKVSFGDHINEPKQLKEFHISEIFDRIRNGEPATTAIIAKLRRGDLTEKEARAVKRGLPFIVFSGTYKRREFEGIKDYTGFITIDFDHLEGPAVNELKDRLKDDPYIYAVFISPGGRGLKALIRFDRFSTADTKKLYDYHLNGYYEVETYFNTQYGQTIDEKCKDYSRSCFLSYDPEIYVNQTAKIWRGEPVKYRNAGGLPKTLYNFDAIERARAGAGKIYLTEGEFDAIILEQENLPAVSLASAGHIPGNLQRLFQGLKVYILTDNDKAGKEAGVKIYETLKQGGVTAERKDLPAGIKDVTEFILSLHRKGLPR